MSAPVASASWTASQAEAIRADGNVLVVAGAGTGKTRTLVERCLRWIDAGESLDHVLLVTFTEAAAAEMRARIRSALVQRAEGSTDTEWGVNHFQEQLALLETASISTLHRFCLELVRSHFHALALDPQLIVLDERQVHPLMEESLRLAIDGWLSGPSGTESAAHALLEGFAGDSVARLREVVVRVHQFAQSLPQPEHWLRIQEELFSEPHPETWTQWFLSFFQEWAMRWRPQLEAFCHNAQVLACWKALDPTRWTSTPDLANARTALQSIYDADVGCSWPRGTKTSVRRPLADFFKEAGFLHGTVVGGAGDSDPLDADWQETRLRMRALIQLVQSFHRIFTRSKRELGGLDFSDLEQLSLRLLYEESGDLSHVAVECRERFHHVFVDEVQDINAAQDAILRAVSRDGASGNRFLVGDIKQSIYRFRLANPEIFREYESRWRQAGAGYHVVTLTENFRSHESILKCINEVFRFWMGSSTKGVVYDDRAALQFGNAEHRSALRHVEGQPRVQLRVVLTSGDESIETTDSTDAATLGGAESEARWIAQRLKTLVETQYPVWDESKCDFRPVRWEDMVVLLRSPGSKAETFAREFHRAQVPLSAARGGFLESSEISDLMSILQLLDNPLQDIPLAAVLRSPFVGFAVEELAEVRIALRRQPLWTALQHIAAMPLDATDSRFEFRKRVQTKCRAFLHPFAKWRETIRLTSLSHCLETILVDTHYEAMLAADPRGEARLANVRKLIELARQFDPFQRQGLFRFLRFIENQQAAPTELESVPVESAHAVRLLSIHRSKGLEFPIVVVADLNKPFNQSDLHQDILLDETLGLCPRMVVPERGIRYSSLPHFLAKSRAKEELVGEELRLLYVAMTRAKDLLILVGNDRNAKAWQEAEPQVSKALNSEAAKLEGRTALAWIRHWMLRQVMPSSVPDESEKIGVVAGRSEWLEWEIGSLNELPTGGAETDTLTTVLPGSTSRSSTDRLPEADIAGNPQLRRVDLSHWLEVLQWKYPFLKATEEPAKTTVSVLRRRAIEARDDAAVPWEALRRSRSVSVSERETARQSPSGVSASERGTSHHVYLQWLDWTKTQSPLDLRNEAERMRTLGILEAKEIESLDFQALLEFWQSSVGQQLRTSIHSAQRELPFTSRLTGKELMQLGLLESLVGWDPEDFVVVQGQIDLAIVKKDEVWLLDFKTDRLGDRSLSERAEAYRVQMQVYALALENIYRRPVTRRWLHFLSARTTVEVPALGAWSDNLEV